MEAFSGLTAAFATLSPASILPKLLLIVLCLAVIKLLLKSVDKILAKSRIDKNLHAVLRAALKILLLFMALMIVAASFGINVSSLLAVLSIAGVAVSLSIQDILSNFFSGVVLLSTKPFKIGDFVTIGGQDGTVVQTGLTHTKLHTPDNQTILVPNSMAASNVITNVTAEATRRVDLSFTLPYAADAEAVRTALLCAAQTEFTLDEPAPFVGIAACRDNCVDYVLRIWVRSEHYWDAYFLLQERTKSAFRDAGISHCVPHMYIHNA